MTPATWKNLSAPFIMSPSDRCQYQVSAVIVCQSNINCCQRLHSVLRNHLTCYHPSVTCHYTQYVIFCQLLPYHHFACYLTPCDSDTISSFYPVYDVFYLYIIFLYVWYLKVVCTFYH